MLTEEEWGERFAGGSLCLRKIKELDTTHHGSTPSLFCHFSKRSVQTLGNESVFVSYATLRSAQHQGGYAHPNVVTSIVTAIGGRRDLKTPSGEKWRGRFRSRLVRDGCPGRGTWALKGRGCVVTGGGGSCRRRGKSAGEARDTQCVCVCTTLPAPFLWCFKMRKERGRGEDCDCQERVKAVGGAL